MKSATTLISVGVLVAGFVLPAFASQAQAKATIQASAASWKSTVTEGNSFTFDDSDLTFHALPNSRADVRRSNSHDLITFSAKTSGWGSIYLVWSPDNWCAVGQISPTPFARIYSTAIVNGKAEQVKHRGIHIDTFRWLRIRLGENYVSFAYSENHQDWITLRTIQRPREYHGTPHMISAGKYYIAHENPFGSTGPAQVSTAPMEEVNGKTHGEWTDGKIENLDIEATPEEDLRLTESELKTATAPEPDPVMALLSENKSDPTYDQVASFYPAMKFPREVVGVPLHPLDIGVDYLGRIDEGTYKPLAWFEVGEPSMPLGSAVRLFERHLLHGYVPVDILSTVINGVEYQITFMGWSEGFSVEKPLYAYLQLTAHAKGGALPRVVSLVSPKGKIHTWAFASNDGTSAEIALKLEFPDPNTAIQVPQEEFSSRMDSISKVWKETLSPATRLDVPDQRVMDAYRAWLAYSMLDTDTVNGFAEPHDGAGFYETMFGNSVSQYSTVLDEYGLSGYAAEILKTQIHFQRDDGLYTAECGLVDPGAFLIGLAEHYRITGDKRWLQSVAPAIIRQANWLMRQRNDSPKTGVTRGLIKFRPYNDYVMATFNYFGNIKCALGLLDAGKALDEIGISDGKEIIRSGQDYREDILDSMSAAIFEYNGQKLLPLEPDTHRLLKLEDYNGGGYYGLTASTLLETGFLAPDDPRASLIIDALEKRGGLLAGLAEFNGGIDHAYTYGYLLNELKLGEVRKTILGFWSMLAYGMARTTYSPVEVTMFKTGENELTLPHLFSCTEQLSLLRTLLLREDGDVLQIGEGIPRVWLSAGRHVAVDSMRTVFGDLSYRIEISNDGTALVQISPPSRRVPTKVVVHLRVAAGGVIKSIQGASPAEMSYSGDAISFSNLRHSIAVKVHFQE